MGDKFQGSSQSNQFFPDINQTGQSMQHFNIPSNSQSTANLFSTGNSLHGFSENEYKRKSMKDENANYMRKVQQEQALKPRRLRRLRNNGDDAPDNAFILDNKSIYDVPPQTRASQRYENGYPDTRLSTGRPISKQQFIPQKQPLQHVQSMPDLQDVQSHQNQLASIPEESNPPAQGGDDVRYEHYLNNQNQKVNKMTIQRPENADGGRPETTYRPDTHANFQNFNWNTNEQTGQQQGYLPPPTAAYGANLWNQGHQQERYIDVELRKSRYGEELRSQMQDNDSKKKINKLDDKVNDFHFLDEFYAYNPYGKGGGGAPLRDQFGNMITSRKPQYRNEYSKNQAMRRGPTYSVMSSSRPMTKRAPTSYTDHYGKPRDLHTRNINIGSYHGNGIPQTGGFHFQPQPVQQVQQQPAAPAIQQPAPQQPIVQQIAHPDPSFRPDYYAQQQAVAPQGDYIRGEHYPYQWDALPNYLDWVKWYNEMFGMLHQDRIAREEEDRLRKKTLEDAEERLRKEKAEIEARYQYEYEKKFKGLMGLQEDQLKRMEEYWERRHADELSTWEQMLRLRPYVDRVDNYDALRTTQGLVDHLQNSTRHELSKIQTDTANNDQQVQKRINNLKSAMKNNIQ